MTCFLEDFLLDGFVYSSKSNILSLLGSFQYFTLGPCQPKGHLWQLCPYLSYPKFLLILYLLIISGIFLTLLCYPPRSSHCYLLLGLSSHIRASDLLLYKPTHSSQRNCFPPKFKFCSLHTLLLKLPQGL